MTGVLPAGPHGGAGRQPRMRMTRTLPALGRISRGVKRLGVTLTHPELVRVDSRPAPAGWRHTLSGEPFSVAPWRWDTVDVRRDLTWHEPPGDGGPLRPAALTAHTRLCASAQPITPAIELRGEQLGELGGDACHRISQQHSQSVSRDHEGHFLWGGACGSTFVKLTANHAPFCFCMT